MVAKQKNKPSGKKEPEEKGLEVGELPEELETALQEIPEEQRAKVLQAFLGF